jgi:outer membrane receptor protein involved in Fe transport
MTDRSQNSKSKNLALVIPRDAAAAGSSVALAVSVALTGSYAPAVLAQNGAADLEAVIVTARKREETLLEIPQEIQAIGQREMERANLSTLEDLQRFVPSLTSIARTPGLGAIYFRGVADDTEARIADSSAAIYLDEQPLTQTQMQPEIRLVDMERIEALPGPQGTLYGSSSQSGTLRYITNKPDPARLHADVNLEGHTVEHGDAGYDLSAVLNLPLDEKAAIRLVGFSARDAGFIDNVLGESLGGSFNNADVAAKDVNAVDYVGGRAAIRWLVDDNWTVDAGVVHQQLNAGTYAEDNVQRGGRELAVVRFLDESRSDDWTQLALTLQGDRGWGQLTSATSYFTRDVAYFQDNTDYDFLLSHDPYLSDPAKCAVDATWLNCAFAFGPDPVGLGWSARELTDRFAQELRLQGSTGKLIWLAGLFYEHMQDEWKWFARTENYEDTQAFEFWNTEYGVQPGTTDNASFSLSGTQVTEQFAIFGEASYSLNERWTLTAGIRWFDHARDREDSAQQPNGHERIGFDEGKGSTSDFTRKLSVQYSISENAMVYALFSEGFRAGGRNRTAPGVLLPVDYVSDYLDNYELGFKSRWDGGRYAFNFTAFEMKWDDYQVEVVDPGAFPEFYVVMVANIGDAEIDGISTDFTAKVRDSLGLGLNFQLLDARVTQGNALVETQSGDRLPYSAEEKGAAWVEYTFPAEVAGGHVYGRFQWSYTGNILNGVSRPRTVQPAYQIADFKIGLESAGWEIYAHVDNLTNERAILRNKEYALLPGTVSINRPRTWGLGFAKSWGGD